MKWVLLHAQIYTGNQYIADGYIRFDMSIKEVGDMSQFVLRQQEQVYHVDGNIVIPGMIDIHIHGGYGIDTMDADPQALLQLSNKLLSEGVTTFFPTTMTQSCEVIMQALQSVKMAKELGAHIGFIHLEGPFLSKARAGAQQISHMMTPDVQTFETFQQCSGNLIKLVTYAPEEESKELETFFEQNGVIGSIGHSDASYAQLSGKNIHHATHLFNQMKGMHHREPGAVGRVLLDRDITVEMIVDGIHIHPEMVRLAYIVKGPEKVCIITDAMKAKGLKDGMYELGGQPVHVQNGIATLENGTLAGSVLTMDQAFRNILTYTGCTIEEAVRMTSVNQAKEFGLLSKGILDVGKDADMVILSPQLEVIDTISLGVFKNELPN